MSSEKTRVPEFENLIAFDAETTGLDTQHEGLLEIFAQFGKLENGAWVALADPIAYVLPTDPEGIGFWHEKVLEMHAKSGLLVESVKRFNELWKTTDFGAAQRNARNLVYFYLTSIDRRLKKEADSLAPEITWTLLGNSVHFDLAFVRRLFPEFAKSLTHRCFDVSAIRMFCESLGMPYPEFPAEHRAGADVQQSLAIREHCSAWVRKTQAGGHKFE